MPTDKKKIEISDRYVKYEGGSFDVSCKDCGKEEHLEPDSKPAIRYSQIEGTASEHLCLNCWKKEQDKFKQAEKDSRRNEIQNGQAYNLAFQAVLKNTDFEDKKFFEKVARYQKLIYENIKNGLE